MSEQQKHINHYSLTDIEQYLQEKLSPSAMHDLEKAALQDPFLADAIEGYRYTDPNEVKGDLAFIQQQLLSGKQITAEIIQTSAKQKNWLRIAALFILIAGAGASALYLVNRNDYKSNSTLQSVNTIRKDSSAVITAMEIKKDTINNKPKQLQTIIARKSDPPAFSRKINQTSLTDDIDTTLNTSKNLIAANGIKGFSFLQKFDSNLADIKRSVSVNLDGRISGINIKSSDDSANLVDKESKQGLYKPLSLASVGNTGKLMVTGTVEAKGFSPGLPAAQLALNKSIQPDNTLSEVVVTGYGTQRKKDITGAVSLTAKDKKDTLIIGSGKIPEIVPVGGMKAFSDYLINQLILHANLKKEPGKYGTLSVRLGFDENGEIIKVKIKRSFDKKLNPVFIKAFTEGPLWLLPKKEKTDFDLTLLL